MTAAEQAIEACFVDPVSKAISSESPETLIHMMNAKNVRRLYGGGLGLWPLLTDWVLLRRWVS